MYPLNDLIPWVVAAAAVAAAALTYAVGVRRGRRRARLAAPAAPKKRGERTDRGDLLAAAIATAVAADGMWATFADMGMPVWLRAATFAFLELAVFQSARRARRAMTENFSAGIDGIAMWVLTCVSAVLAVAHEVSLDDPNMAVVLVRLVAPLVAAWGWERSMALERRLRGLRTSGITWRVTPARVAVRLGLAEVGDRTTDQVDAHRRLVRVARAADRARTLRETDAAGWRQRRALRRAKVAMDEANEYAKLANDEQLQAALLEQIGAVYNTSAFVEMDARPWWTPEPVREEAPDAPVREGGPDRTDDGPRTESDRTDEAERTEEARTSDRLVQRLRLRREAEQAMRDAVRGVEDQSVRVRTEAPRTTLVRARTGEVVAPARTDEPPVVAGQGEVIALPLDVQEEPAATAVPAVAKDRTDGPDRTAEQPRTPAPDRTGKPRTVAAAEPRTGRTGGVRMDVRKPRTHWVGVLMEEIRTVPSWAPDYEALMDRTGYGRSWCEKTVRAAREAAEARTGAEGA